MVSAIYHPKRVTGNQRPTETIIESLGPLDHGGVPKIPKTWSLYVPIPPTKRLHSSPEPTEASQISWQTAGAGLLPGPLDSGSPAFASP